MLVFTIFFLVKYCILHTFVLLYSYRIVIKKKNNQDIEKVMVIHFYFFISLTLWCRAPGAAGQGHEAGGGEEEGGAGGSPAGD